MNRQPPHARDARFAAARRERRERNRKKPDIAGAVRVAVALLLVTQSLRVAFTSPRLRLQEVKVTGTQRLSPADVQRVGRVPLGQNVFRCNLVQVSTQLRTDPIIKDAVVTRELPGTIRVVVTERVPAIQIMAGADRFDADEDGFVFQRAGALKRDLPLIQLPSKKLPAIGQKLAADIFKAARECNRLAKAQGLQLRNLRVDEGGELWLNVGTSPLKSSSPSELVVRLGRDTELPQKFRDIHQLIIGKPELASQASYLVVMSAGNPSYMSKADPTESN